MQGVGVKITVWDQDTELAEFRQEDMIDEYSFDLQMMPGSQTVDLGLNGIRTNPTRYCYLELPLKILIIITFSY